MVVSVERIRNEYERVEDRLYQLRCVYGYSGAYSKVFRTLEARAERLDKILRHMEKAWGLK
ncbi:MAG: hypothetical protein ACOYEP_06645 [Limnochordia bacterium]|jgi:hypothetical protein